MPQTNHHALGKWHDDELVKQLHLLKEVTFEDIDKLDDPSLTLEWETLGRIQRQLNNLLLSFPEAQRVSHQPLYGYLFHLGSLMEHARFRLKLRLHPIPAGGIPQSPAYTKREDAMQQLKAIPKGTEWNNYVQTFKEKHIKADTALGVGTTAVGQMVLDGIGKMAARACYYFDQELLRTSNWKLSAAQKFKDIDGNHATMNGFCHEVNFLVNVLARDSKSSQCLLRCKEHPLVHGYPERQQFQSDTFEVNRQEEFRLKVKGTTHSAGVDCVIVPKVLHSGSYCGHLVVLMEWTPSIFLKTLLDELDKKHVRKSGPGPLAGDNHNMSSPPFIERLKAQTISRHVLQLVKWTQSIVTFYQILHQLGYQTSTLLPEHFTVDVECRLHLFGVYSAVHVLDPAREHQDIKQALKNLILLLHLPFAHILQNITSFPTFATALKMISEQLLLRTEEECTTMPELEEHLDRSCHIKHQLESLTIPQLPVQMRTGH